MAFFTAASFMDSLNGLQSDEQKAAKLTAFDLQTNPANPGMSFHKLDRAKDRRFHSVRVNADIRIIVHKSDASLVLCYVGHHDDAYRWAERRKLETHPTTGAAQMVEIRERIEEVVVPLYVAPTQEATTTGEQMFAHLSDDQLLSYGVPPEWLGDVREATEDSLLGLAEHLPAEAAEALLQLATGEQPTPAPRLAAATDPLLHPDAQRRFRVMADREELEQALDFSWDKWMVFLHPAQRELVEREWNGAVRVSGSAGTGKTIVALHRAARMARNHPQARILLTTLSDTLAQALRYKLRQLMGLLPEALERIDVHGIDAVALRLFRATGQKPHLVDDQTMGDILDRAASEGDLVGGFSSPFLRSEWREVVDAWGLETWEAYRDVPRLGRKRRLNEARRREAWGVFHRALKELEERDLMTLSMLFGRLARRYGDCDKRPYDFIIVDEAQDIGVAQLRFLAALGAGRPDSLFFTGDLGQQIFQTPFSWKALGVDIRGRSQTLRVNYRTSHQIRRLADRLLAEALSDADGNQESRRGVNSVFNGPEPQARVFDNEQEEAVAVADWLRDLVVQGAEPHEIGVFTRSADQFDRAREAIRQAGLAAACLDEGEQPQDGQVSIGTMALAKGLEFRAVAVMACDEGVLPLEERLAGAADGSDHEAIYNTERHLLYVACTRARDVLLVSAVAPGSEFLGDLAETGSAGRFDE